MSKYTCYGTEIHMLWYWNTHVMVLKYTCYGTEIHMLWYWNTHVMVLKYTYYGTEIHILWYWNRKYPSCNSVLLSFPNRSTCQEISHLLYKTKVQHPVHNSQPLVRIFKQINPSTPSHTTKLPTWPQTSTEHILYGKPTVSCPVKRSLNFRQPESS